MPVTPVTLKNVQSIGPLQRSYKWQIDFGGSTIGNVDVPGLNSVDLQNMLDTVNIRCISASVPVPRIDPVTAAPHGVDIDEPGIVHLNGNIQFTIVETTDLRARKMLYYLQQLNMTDSDKRQADIHSAGTIASPVNIVAKLQRLDNQNQINLAYVCQKCYIENFTDPGFESTSGVVQPQFTLHYNYFEMIFNTITAVNSASDTINSLGSR